MKKLIALLLCAAVALCCAAACAEEEAPAKENLTVISINGVFALEGVLPEGYKFTQSADSDTTHMTGFFDSEDLSKPVMQLSIYADDTIADVERFNDLSDEEVAYWESTFTADSQVEITYTETSLGTKLMVVRETGNDRDYIDFFSIYKGHLIDLVLVAGPEAVDPALTDEQVDMCVKLLSDLDFVPYEG